jgi:hypothetical protein
MTATRQLPLQLHTAIEALLAPAMIVVPFALGFDGVALIASALLAALVMGSALQVGGTRVSAHRGLDAVILTLAGALAIGFGLAGALGEAWLFALLGAIEALLATSTRYSAVARSSRLDNFPRTYPHR